MNQQKIRNTFIRKDLQIVSAFDYITAACKYKIDNNNSRVAYARLIKPKKGEKACHFNVIMFQFPGAGQRKTPCLATTDLLELTHMLGSRVSIAFREETLKILERYLDGDLSLCEEVLENKQMGKEMSCARFAAKVTLRVEELEIQAQNEMPPVSYVYATRSPAFPDLIKIGRTVDVKARLSSLNTSCSPAPHVVVAVSPSFDNIRDEADAHAFFESNRGEGEFFRITLDQVQTYFSLQIMTKYQHELNDNITRLQRA
jgi:hypothetical protein